MNGLSIRLEKLLSWLTLLTAVAYSLGWLKTYYYFDSFGIPLSSLEFSVTDYLFESWFVLENVVFFSLLCWFVIKLPLWWPITIGIIYFFLPVASHYAFLWPENIVAHFLITYRHTILKFLPFALYLAVFIFDRKSFQHFKELSWPYSTAGLVLFIVIIAAWSVSTAKHFGGFDANRAQMTPDNFLPHVTIHFVPGVSNPDEITKAEELYLIHVTPNRYFIWNHKDFIFGGEKASVNVIVIPKEKVDRIETRKAFHVQPGSLFL